MQARDGDENELFYANNTIKWMPGLSGTWSNYRNRDNRMILGSGDIETRSDVRLNEMINWDADLLFNYGDHKYSLMIEDYSGYDHVERFVTHGHGRYGGDLNAW
jgi:hypothetical protein